MQKRIDPVALIIFFLIGHFYQVVARDRDKYQEFEIHFFMNGQSSFDEITFDDPAVTFSDKHEKRYYNLALASITANKVKKTNLLDSLTTQMKDLLSGDFSYDTLGYIHYLQYLQHYQNGDHLKAMEQLIYAKETFRRTGRDLMFLECLFKYYGNYSNSIFGRMAVEDFSHVIKLIEANSYLLSDSVSMEFWAKMALYEKAGVLLGLDGQFELSQKYLTYVIEHTDDKTNSRFYYNALGDLSINQYRSGNYQASIKNALLDLESSLKLNRSFSITVLGVLLAKNHLALGQADQALKYIQMADTFSTKLNGILRVDILETRAEYFRKIGQTATANNYFQQYLTHKDSINMNAIRQMEFRMKTEQDFYLKLKDYEEKNRQNLATINAQRTRYTIIMTVLVLLSIAVLIFGWLIKNIRKKNKLLREQKLEITQANEELQCQQEELKAQNEKISELNRRLEQKIYERTQDLAEKGKIINTFFYQMSHRFRSPIASLKGLMNLIRFEHKAETIPSYIDLSYKSISKLDDLLNHIKQLLEFDQKTENKENIYLNEMIEDILFELDEKYKTTNMKVNNYLVNENSPAVNSVKGYKKILFREVLDNAFKFSILNNKSRIPEVNIRLRQLPEKYQLIVEDNGPGISKELWNQVSEPFYVGNEHSTGDGLGFYVASIAANKTSCKINLDESYTYGARMIIEIPVEVKEPVDVV